MAQSRTADVSRDAQAAIAAEAAALAARAWSDLDLKALRLSLPGFKRQVAAAVLRFVPAAATAGLRFYMDERRAAGVAGRPRFHLPEAPPLEQIGKAADWAAAPLWGQSDMPAAEARLEAVTERLVLNAGRDAIVAAVEQDRAAKAWARVPESGCCYWCAAIATRGAVYRSAHSAGEDNGYHDNCKCHVEPVFNAYEPTAEIRQWQGHWARLRQEHGGSLSMDVWRREFEAGFTPSA